MKATKAYSYMHNPWLFNSLDSITYYGVHNIVKGVAEYFKYINNFFQKKNNGGLGIGLCTSAEI